MDSQRDILFIGDSLIEYFDWEARFPGRRVFNLGISGETVEWLLERLDRVVAGHPSVCAVFLMTGINNVAMEETGFIGDYRRILEKLNTAYPGARIYVTSLLPTLLPWIEPGTIARMNGLLKGLAGECGARYVDVHGIFLGDDLKGCLSPDGIHLSQRGYALWSEAIEPLVECD